MLFYKSSDSKRQVYTGAWSCGLPPDIVYYCLFIFAYFVIQGSVTLKRTDINEDEVRKARVKCEMLAALEACRLLHVMGELTDDLQPVFRCT